MAEFLPGELLSLLAFIFISLFSYAFSFSFCFSFSFPIIIKSEGPYSLHSLQSHTLIPFWHTCVSHSWAARSLANVSTFFLCKHDYPLSFTEGFIACRNLIPVILEDFYFPGYFCLEFWPTASYKVSRFLPNIIIKCFLCETLSFPKHLEEGNRKNNVGICIRSFLLKANSLWMLTQFQQE